MIFIKKRKKYLLKVDAFFKQLDSFENKYISRKSQRNIIRKYSIIYKYFKLKLKNKNIRKFMKIYKNFDSYIELHNSVYIKDELSIHENLLNSIDGKSLDLQQKMAVISDEKNNLIIAGAGSGKTLTISGKVKYLIESRKS